MAGRYLKCLQCHQMTDKLFMDPRKPPIDPYKCLCIQCLGYAQEEAMETMQEKLADLNLME